MGKNTRLHGRITHDLKMQKEKGLKRYGCQEEHDVYAGMEEGMQNNNHFKILNMNDTNCVGERSQKGSSDCPTGN